MEQYCMKFEFVIEAEIPRLAWLAIVEKSSEIIRVYAGGE